MMKLLTLIVFDQLFLNADNHSQRPFSLDINNIAIAFQIAFKASSLPPQIVSIAIPYESHVL